MQKTLIAVVILVLVGIGLYYLLTSYTPSPDALSELNQEMQEGEVMASGEARGIVVGVDTQQAAVDGPVLVLLQQENGEAALVAVPSMGLPTCAARTNMADAFALQPGQLVEVKGSVGAEGVIVPCESADHYLRVVEAQ